MNTRLICTVVVTLLAAGCLFAQSSSTLSANVPFGFQAGGVNFPAGAYIIDKPNPVVIRLASADRKHVAMVLTFTADKPGGDEVSKLIFHCYGEKYFLSQVWTAGNGGRQLPPGRAEREMARAANQPVERALVARKLN